MTRWWTLLRRHSSRVDPRKQPPLQIGPQQSRARSGEAGPLTARIDPGSSRARGKGILAVSINRYICISLYFHCFFEWLRLACQVEKALIGTLEPGSPFTLAKTPLKRML